MVVEHHGGPKRLARLSVVIAPPGALYWVYGVLAGLAPTLERFGGIIPAAVVATSFAVLWIVSTTEANRLEAGIVAAAAGAAVELEAENDVASAPSSADHDIGELGVRVGETRLDT
jgi:hypothetical protein